MAYSNANYLHNPNRLSTKVHYAPGGQSSLSLAWNNTPQPSNNKQKSRSVAVSEMLNDSKVQMSPQNKQLYYPHQQYQAPHQQYQPAHQYQQDAVRNKSNYEGSAGYQDIYSESNRMLEAELRYYQQRNKLFRQNIFGGQNNLDQISSHSMRNQQYSNPYANNYQREPNNYNISGLQESGKYNQRPDELQMAVYQQGRRVAQDRQQSSYMQNKPFSSPSLTQQKAHIKVHQPPGGRSSIFFG